RETALPHQGRAIANENRSSRTLSGGSRTRGCHTGFLPLKGGGEEGVGATSRVGRLVPRSNVCDMRWARFCESIEAGPTPSSPPPFRGRNPVWQPRVLLPLDSDRDDLFPYAIALHQGGGGRRVL